MNILFLTLLDFSSIKEKGIYPDLIREFIKNGHRVYIVSPTEKRKKEPTKLIDDQNTKILKLQIGNIQKTNFIEKGISTISLDRKFITGIKKYFYDVKFNMVLYSTPPITIERVVEFVKKRDNSKAYLLLKDIFPQNAIDLGVLKTTGLKSVIYNYFKKKEERLYRISDYIGCMSENNVKFLLNNNYTIDIGVVEVCPNSIEPLDIDITEYEKTMIREKYNIPRDKIVFIYGGNLGKPQGVDFLIECLKANEYNEEVFFLIVGSGTEYNKINNFLRDKKPGKAKLLKQLPKSEYEMLTNSCDVGLIFLDRRFTIPNFPSRILSYMQASMPVLAATDVNTDIKDIIIKGEFGYWCESGDIEKFINLVNELCNDKKRIKLGFNARKYLEENYTTKQSYDIIMKHFK